MVDMSDDLASPHLDREDVQILSVLYPNDSWSNCKLLLPLYRNHHRCYFFALMGTYIKTELRAGQENKPLQLK
jgi:hypothetical protein